VRGIVKIRGIIKIKGIIKIRGIVKIKGIIKIKKEKKEKMFLRLEKKSAHISLRRYKCQYTNCA